jgi:FKBP-type peptidyl-prolyl cis-trans isomerase SlpA
MKEHLISKGSQVVMHFSLSLDDGTEVISTFDGEPISFAIGDGTLEPALESTLIGRKTGDEQTQQLSGNDIYGTWESDNRQWIERRDFPATLDLAVAQIIAFTTPAGDEIAGAIVELDESRVLIDFNHPLSGRTIIFKTAIVAADEME